MRRQKVGFSLIELMVVILIIAILASAAIPLMKLRIDNSKWSEANAAAGLIRNAAKTYFFQTGKKLTGSLSEAETRSALGINPTDLTGTYFESSDYEIESVSDDGVAVIKVTGSLPNAPEGTKTLTLEGKWE